LIPALFLSQHARQTVSRPLCGRDGGQPSAKAFEPIMPQQIPGERIEAEDFTTTSGQNSRSIQNDVDEVVALESCRPDLLPAGAIQRDDRPFNAAKTNSEVFISF
jgi:hypothetical protein